MDTNTESANNFSISQFQQIFISPHEANLSFQHCQKLIALGDTFCKARFVQTLLLAATIHANGHIILLAWAIMEGENKDSWSYFMTHFEKVIPDSGFTTIMSDRDKGSLIVEDILDPRIRRAHCCFHLRENFKARARIRLTDKYFWKFMETKTAAIYSELISNL